MRKIAMLIVLAFCASSAFARNCPVQMKAIDEALPKAKLDAAKTAEVKKLRAEGESLHKAGKHPESEAALGKAKAILGIK